MSLPLQAIDRLFDRLTVTYGKQFLNLYEGMDLNAVKSAWAYELDGYERNLNPIAWALERLPDRPPNAVAFKNICRQAPATELPKLEQAPAGKERIKSELQKMGDLRESPNKGVDGRDWARRIVSRKAAGDFIHRATLLMAKQALKETS